MVLGFKTYNTKIYDARGENKNATSRPRCTNKQVGYFCVE